MEFLGISPYWAGAFIDIDDAVGIDGVNALHDALLTLDWSRRKDAAAQRTLFVGSWLRHLRVHQTLARKLTTTGLSSPMPLIVGANDIEPFVTVAYWPERDEIDAAGKTALEIAARRQDLRTKVTDETIAEWRELHTTYGGWRGNTDLYFSDQRRNFQKNYEDCQRYGLPELDGLPYSFEGTDAEFEYLIALYRHLRHPDQDRPQLPS